LLKGGTKMTRTEKMKKAVAIAVAYYIKQENDIIQTEKPARAGYGWNQAGKALQMNIQRTMQSRGSIRKPQSLMRNEEPNVLRVKI